MGRLHKVFLDSPDVYRCVQCDSHLAYLKDLESNSFQSGAHRAFLFTSVVNVDMGPPADRPLRTGLHVVSDLYCSQCLVNVGWFYNHAYEPAQKYKEHKFILVENCIVKHDTHMQQYAAEGQHQLQQHSQSSQSSRGSSSSRRSNTDSGRRMRDEDEDEEEEEEEEEQDDGSGRDEEQREGRSRRAAASGGSGRSGAGRSGLQASMLPSAASTSSRTALAGVPGVFLPPGSHRATVRLRMSHAPSSF